MKKGIKILLVGGGTAGANVAKNLSRDFDVTIFEKGKNKLIPLFYRIPLMVGLLFQRSKGFVDKINIKFNSDRNVPFYQSNFIGGASVINGCVHVMGNQARWKGMLDRFGLSLNDLRKSYEKIFSKKSAYRKIKLTAAKEGFLERCFRAALKEKGIPAGDVEWTDAIGSGMVLNTTNWYIRSSVLDLKPFGQSKVIDDCEIERLVVDKNKKIVGVFDGKRMFLGDVVFVCAGVIGTNKLLLSQAIRVDTGELIDLDLNAGNRIKDHTNLRVNVKASIRLGSLNEIEASLVEKFKLVAKYVIGMWTMMRGTGATATANIDICGDGFVDTRINLLRFYEDGRLGSMGKLFTSKKPGFSISITQINPKSVGVVDYRATDLQVVPNYLSDSRDMEHLKKALKYVLDILDTPPISDFVEKINDLEMIRTAPEKYILENTYSGYHLIGGCEHLLGCDFEVKDYPNLYLCDASIISEYPSPNIHSTVALLADLCAAKFLRKHREWLGR